MNRRGFLGGLIATVASFSIAATAGEQKSQPMMLATKQCPKCKDWTLLPIKTTRKPDKHYQPVSIVCKCRKCDYQIVADVLCMVHPLM